MHKPVVRQKTVPAQPKTSVPAQQPSGSVVQTFTAPAGALWPPAFGLAPAGKSADAAPPSVIQRLKVGDKVTKKTYDTDELDPFQEWCKELLGKDRDRLIKLYGLLDGVETKDRNEATMTSFVRRLLDRTYVSKDSDTDSLLSKLPRERWWKLFLEGKAHDKGALGFDNEQSPGYYAAMMKAFQTDLLPKDQVDKPMTFAEYDRMHLAVTKGVLKEKDDGTFEPVPHEKSGTTWGGLGGSQTEFPMTRPDKAPSLASIREMVLDGEIALEGESSTWLTEWVKQNPDGEKYFHDLWTLMNTVKPLNPHHTPTSLLKLEVKGNRVQHLVWTDYAKSDVEGKVNAIFDRYYQERDAAKLLEDEDVSRRAVLKAIVRTVRSLHVGHFFADANGRLNTMLLLNKLLLAEGLTPVILPDTSIFGGESSTNQLVQSVIQGVENFIAEVRS